MSERIAFVSHRPSGDIELEGLLGLPDRAGGARGIVVCHPHPAGGGSMDVTLLEVIERRATRVGFTVLRFNFGGVGESGGAFSDGLEEPCDVDAACEYLRSREEVDAAKVSLAGWSFGAWMCLLALARGLEVQGCAAIAPPLMLYDWRQYADAISASDCLRHYILGANDQFCSLDSLQEFTEALGGEDTENTHILPMTDHYLSGREDIVAELVIECIENSRR